ncbi:hypothetical protein KSP39_PZI004094 [Platanthera zijinensis]|uniref:Uncharacterized protein n=1 Tax=Platanthera zijinensis TaxID=2320716 RepID=A0AAP0GCQ2_9ASPA
MFLQSQSKNRFVSYLAAASFGLHILLSKIVVSKLAMGVADAMGSMILDLWITVLGKFLFILCGGCPDTWKGFSWMAFHDLWPVIRLSISSGAMVW